MADREVFALNWTPEQIAERDLRMAMPTLPKGKPAPAKANKYKRAAAVDRAYNGVVYDSKREAKHAMELDILKQGGRILNIERQVPFELRVNDHKVCKIVIDFKVTWHTGDVCYQEVKGFETRDWIIKRKLFNALYPDLTYEVIK